MVVAFRLHGSYGRAAKACGTKPEHVRKWVERFRATGGVEDAPRSGRPSLGLQKPRCRQILKRGVAAKLACYKMADNLKKSLGVYASPETVRRALRGMGNRALRRRNVLRLKEKHKANRLRFAKHWSRFSWRNVVVSDSKHFHFIDPKGSRTGSTHEGVCQRRVQCPCVRSCEQVWSDSSLHDCWNHRAHHHLR